MFVVVVVDDFTHSAHSLMREVPGIQARAKIVIVWLTPQNITRKSPSRAVRNDPVNVFVPQCSLRLAKAFGVHQYLDRC